MTLPSKGFSGSHMATQPTSAKLQGMPDWLLLARRFGILYPAYGRQRRKTCALGYPRSEVPRNSTLTEIFTIWSAGRESPNRSTISGPFNEAIRRHCDEVALIMRAFARDWLGKNHSRDGKQVTKDDIRRFSGHTVEKIRIELDQRKGAL